MIQPRVYKELTSYTNEDSQEVTISNSSLELTVDKDTTTFVLKDKKNGKEYRSNPSSEDIEKYANAKGQLKEMLNATLLVKYSNKTVHRRISTIIASPFWMATIRLKK